MFTLHIKRVDLYLNVPAFLHKGEVVVDADSAGPAKNMLLAINQAKDSRVLMQSQSTHHMT